MILRGFLTTLLLLALFIFTTTFLQAGITNEPSETDGGDFQLIAFFDLRDRETFVQITNTDNIHESSTVHVQIFNVNDLCNENNFFDNYTRNDTHVYNIRNILTNDGNPSGVVLPENAYGIVVVTCQIKDLASLTSMIGNVRILDANGYEYRTNMQGVGFNLEEPDPQIYTFNFNTKSGATLSDVVGIALTGLGNENVSASADIYQAFDVDIINENEVIFSCRNVLFACIDQNNPRLEGILANSGDANVASFEYGINNAIPHSKGGELLCPGNTISDGVVRLDLLSGSPANGEAFIYIGLNNGNGRGSFDSAWLQSYVIVPMPMGKG